MIADIATESISFVEAIILGLVEGLTEFIPISSTGHLILARQFLGLGEGGLAFDAALQAATALAILFYFWRDILNLIKAIPQALNFKASLISKEVSEVRAVFVISIPIVIFGLLFDGFIEESAREMDVVIVGLLLGAILLWLADKKLEGVKESLNLGFLKSITLGFFQALALWPGVSRSGATISGGAFLGLSRENAARIAFIAGLPVLLGAGGVKLVELIIINGEISNNLGPLITASLVGFISGYAAIGFLMHFLKNHSLKIFVWYRIALVIVLFFLV